MDIVSGLNQFGLTRQEATIYTVLLENGRMTGYEVAKRTNISRSNVYTALAGLVEKGAADLVEGEPMYYVPIAVHDFLDNKLYQLNEIKEKILLQAPKPLGPVDNYATVKNDVHILAKMRNMIDNAKFRIYFSAQQEVVQKLNYNLREAVRRGLKIVIITSGNEYVLENAQVYLNRENSTQVRLITDSSSALTGDYIPGNDRCTCLYSGKQNLIDLIKDALKNEIRLITIKGNRV